MHNVPGTQAVDKVLDGATTVDANERGDESRKDSGVCRGPVFLNDVPRVTE